MTIPKKEDMKFDHSNDIFHDAIGLSRKEVIELITQSKKIFENLDKEKKSLAVEKILNVINDMNHKEISVVIFLLLDYVQHKISDTLLDKIVKTVASPSKPDSGDKFNPSYM